MYEVLHWDHAADDTSRQQHQAVVSCASSIYHGDDDVLCPLPLPSFTRHSNRRPVSSIFGAGCLLFGESCCPVVWVGGFIAGCRLLEFFLVVSL